jgi:endogenous inhibitor of DNA gyrase (YacG/DUF329 family)
MTEKICPSCGRELPRELGQHAEAPLSGLVNCPHCGAEVHLTKADATRSDDAASSGRPGKPSTPDFEPPTSPERDAPPRPEESESFAGHETVEGVRDELRRKAEGG